MNQVVQEGVTCPWLDFAAIHADGAGEAAIFFVQSNEGQTFNDDFIHDPWRDEPTAIHNVLVADDPEWRGLIAIRVILHGAWAWL